jgi:putative N-acetylmannosamine-6-phosphate epimerase
VKQEKQNKWPVIARLKGALIVSCQASEGEPLCAPEHIKALALSAIAGGAMALRLEGAANISTVRAVTDLPIVGLSKAKSVRDADRLKSVYITATFDEAQTLAQAGADIIALDATSRPRAGGITLAQLISEIHNSLKLPVLADISTLAEAIEAQRLGADLVSTTLSGYTQETAQPYEAEPALDLLEKMQNSITVPTILEGRVWHPNEVTRAFNIGAHAVVVGSAITRPQIITERFVKAIPQKAGAVN